MSNAARRVFAVVGALMAFAWALPAQAHITMIGDIVSRGGDQKMSPCDGAKGDGPVYTFQPGATINLRLTETVHHPSYFRISFDDDGDDAFVEPKSIKPVDPARPCPFNTDDQCGKSDYCNVVSGAEGATVLWDDLNPHLAADAKDMSWNIKLPDIECENCTIQVIQVMEDTVHGAYCPDGSCANSKMSLEDVYHRCIDIQLKRDATNGPSTTTDAVNNQGVNCLTDAADANSGGSAAVGGAVSSAGGSGGAGGKGGAGGSAAKPTSNNAGAAAGSAATDSKSDSGCSVSHAGAGSPAGFAWVAILGSALAVARLRRRRRC